MTLRTYQAEAVLHLWEHKRAMLILDMGLG